MEESMNSQLRRSGTAATRRKPVASPEPTAVPLLDKVSGHRDAPRGWPTEPKPIKTAIYTSAWSIFVDVILSGFSIAFFAFALIVNSYNQAPTAKYPQATERLRSAIKYGPTVFPILFAAVVGRATHAILLWRLERGERTGILDTLAASTSLTSTVTSQLRLRTISLLGIVLVAIWALSPVGGQASFRQMTIDIKLATNSTSYRYMVPGSFEDGIYNTGPGLTTAAIMTPKETKQSPRDNWNNVKIPRVEYYEDLGNPDDKDWFHTSLGKWDRSGSMSDDRTVYDSAVYASLIGVPIDPLRDATVVDRKLNLHTMYLNLSCVLLRPSSEKSPDSEHNVTSVAGRGGLYWVDNLSPDGYHSSRSKSLNQTDSLDPFNFTYVPPSISVDESECSLRTTYVEVEVSCPDVSNCHVSMIRRSRLTHPSPNITQMDAYSSLDPVNRFYSNWFHFASSFIDVGVDEVLGSYFNAAVDFATKEDEFQKVQPSAHLYSVRMEQLMNAHWWSLCGSYAITGGLNNHTSYPDPNIGFTMNATGYDGGTQYRGLDAAARTWSTQGEHSIKKEIIQAHWGWTVSLSFVSIVLIAASLIPPIMRFFLTKGPDVEMNISSLATRKNDLYMALPASGSYMDASERARILRDYKVRFGDVDSKDDIGTLTIGALGGSQESYVARVRKGRLYQ